MSITEETTLAELELELVRIGASMFARAITRADQLILGTIPASHRIGVFLTADTLAAFESGVTLAQATHMALVRLRESLQRMHEGHKLPPHVILHDPELVPA